MKMNMSSMIAALYAGVATFLHKAGHDAEEAASKAMSIIVPALPVLTQAAIAVEVVSGNAALVPLTQAAGTSAEQLASLAAAHTTAADTINQLSQIATTVATASGNADVVSQINDATSKAQAALSVAQPVIDALSTAAAASSSQS